PLVEGLALDDEKIGKLAREAVLAVVEHARRKAGVRPAEPSLSGNSPVVRIEDRWLRVERAIKPLPDGREPRLDEREAPARPKHVRGAPQETGGVGQVMEHVEAGNRVERSGIELVRD